MVVNQMEWKKKVPLFEYNEDLEDIQTILSKIHGIEDIVRFLNPSDSEIHSPYLLKNIIEGRDRIVSAIKNSEKISIFSDP
jgi:hypothetical protein